MEGRGTRYIKNYRFCPFSDFLTFGQISDFHIFSSGGLLFTLLIWMLACFHFLLCCHSLCMHTRLFFVLELFCQCSRLAFEHSSVPVHCPLLFTHRFSKCPRFESWIHFIYFVNCSSLTQHKPTKNPFLSHDIF